MKAKDLIEQLSKNPEAEVCIFDHLKHLNRYRDEPIGDGIVHQFEVDFSTMEVPLESVDDQKPFIALVFKNDDYTDYGDRINHDNKN